jgi:hypothetical protein
MYSIKKSPTDLLVRDQILERPFGNEAHGEGRNRRVKQDRQDVVADSHCEAFVVLRAPVSLESGVFFIRGVVLVVVSTLVSEKRQHRLVEERPQDVQPVRAARVFLVGVLVRVPRDHVLPVRGVDQEQSQNAAVDVTTRGEVARVALDSGG